MPPLSPRAELLRLHKSIYRRNKRLIEESVIHEDPTFKQYERRYLNAVKDYRDVATPEEGLEAVLEADIIYIGDYHTLNQSQRSLLRMLRLLVEKTKNFCLAMEVIQSRHQKFLDRYLKGRLTDKTFVKKVGFQEHWFFDLWQNFRPLFDFVREHSIPVFGIEADPETVAGLKRREKAMAVKISELRRGNRERKILVFVGDLHIAPPHLPRLVDSILSRDGIENRSVFFYQNSEAIYWKLVEREIEDKALLVRLSKNEFCRMHTPPIIAQQSYLNWLEHEETVLDFADAKQTFLACLTQMADFLEIRLGPEKEEVEVFTCGDLSFLKKLRESRVFTGKELREIKRQILRSESYYIPKKKYVYLANVSINHAAEEAAHALRHLCAGEEFPRPMQDAFYANIIHEALGFFGSKIINPRRKCLRAADCRKLLDYLRHTGKFRQRNPEHQAARLFIDHENQVSRGGSFTDEHVARLSTDEFLGLTHAAGYSLGERIFHGLLKEKIDKKTIANLFHDAMEEEGEAVRIYLDLFLRLKTVKLPQKI